MATELLTIKKYEFSDGTVIRVKVDFENNKVSLVDKNGSNTNFLFAGRGVEYMNGWVNILGAMQYAIRAARDELTAWQEAKKDKDTKLTNFPKMDTKKFSKLIKQPHSEVLRVQASNSFEQYQDNDTSYDDLMKMFMGGSNPFGGAR